LQRIVAVKLKQDWAPQQITGWLKEEYPENPELWVSHETIYRSLFVQARRALKKELIGHLRSKRRIRRSRHATYRGAGRGEIIDALSIRQRPAEVEDRAIPGHWEGDLLERPRGTFIATLVEARSRFVMLVKLTDTRTEVVVDTLIKAVRKLPTALRRSLTWDREWSLRTMLNLLLLPTWRSILRPLECVATRQQREYERSAATVIRRKWISPMSVKPQLDAVAKKSNTRPRDTLHWKTSAYILGTGVSMIH